MRKLVRNIRNILSWTVVYIINRIYAIIFKMDDHKVLILSDVRSSLGGNLKFVYDEIEKKHKYEVVFQFKIDRRIKRNFKEYHKLLYDLATSKYILLDDYSRDINLMKVKKGQEVIQLWHGPGAFKKFGYSRPGHSKYKNIFFAGHKNYTKAIVTADEIRWCFAEGFGMNMEKVKATGFPRTDIFFDKNYISNIKEELYNEFPNFRGKKIITFAPTYRGDSTSVANYDFSKLDLDKIYNEFKDEYIFIIKWHPAIYNNIKIGQILNYNLDKYNGFFIDLSDKRDINDLLFITDILITDYSSVIFDYLLCNKPIIYYTYDLESYENGRGLYFNFKDYVYGAVAKNIEELVAALKDEKMCEELREEFKKKFMSACDGNSTIKTCNWIFGEDFENKEKKI